MAGIVNKEELKTFSGAIDSINQSGQKLGQVMIKVDRGFITKQTNYLIHQFLLYYQL